ncbi:MAG: formylglycine-generating enzyme family protein [Candidatus Electrothrix communis]|nr:formylglycine-generating enzyme family protein [Desulfobulbus sp. US4]WLE97464.1 MAG: formylglycine-generating enzyme family protein [Candidatus Electrothrix communis]
MGLESLSFVNIEWMKQLYRQLKQFTDERAQELDRLGDDFVDPLELTRFYVEPSLQAYRPLSRRNGVLSLDPCQPAFSLLNKFFTGGVPNNRDGSHQLILLGEPGSGKSSLLLILKLMSLAEFWPKGYHCLLLKLDEHTLDQIAAVDNKAKTILLIDALNEDKQARNRPLERLFPLLRAGEPFCRMVISCRSHFFPALIPDSTGRLRIRALSGYNCPILYMAPFAAHQVREVLHKRLALNTENYIGFQRFGVDRQRKKAAQLLARLGELGGRPLILHHINSLIEIEGHRIRDAYRIYEALIQHWLEQQADVLEENGCRCPPKRLGLFNAYVRLARWMEEQGVREIGERALQELFCEKAEICRFAHCCHDPALLRVTTEHTYRFTHITYREFLLVHALVYDNRPFSAPLRATDQMVRFLDLVHGITDYVSRLNLAEFNPFRYAETYRTMFSWQDRLGRVRNRVVRGPEMIMLPGGRFKMGDIQGGGSADARPVHEVELDNFALSRYPITFEEYDLYCVATGTRKPSDNGWGRRRRPVVDVSWQDANNYCDWLSMVTGRPYRLPTEAEWEYGCRASTDTVFFFGNDVRFLHEYAWYTENAGNTTHPVGQRKANSWGLYDLYGNVWEWCADSYKKDYYTELPMNNPSGAEQGGVGRVLRGGSWDSGERFICSSFRFRLSPGLRIIRVGFRVAQGYKE